MSGRSIPTAKIDFQSFCARVRVSSLVSPAVLPSTRPKPINGPVANKYLRDKYTRLHNTQRKNAQNEHVMIRRVERLAVPSEASIDIGEHETARARRKSPTPPPSDDRTAPEGATKADAYPANPMSVAAAVGKGLTIFPVETEEAKRRRYRRLYLGVKDGRKMIETIEHVNQLNLQSGPRIHRQDHEGDFMPNSNTGEEISKGGRHE